MKYLSIATTILFAILSVKFPQAILACAFVTCGSYALWGFSYYTNKKFEKRGSNLDPELQELHLEFEKAQISSKISEIRRHTASQEERHVRQQKQEKEFSKGIMW